MNTTIGHVGHTGTEVSWSRFVRHLVEMIVAMLVGMLVLGSVVSMMMGLLGHANLLHYAGLRGLLMTGYMTVGMGLWMRHRRHSWRMVAEMAGAMVLPYVLLIGPYAAGALSPAVFLGAMHALMLPSMVGAMLYRREAYARDHRGHATAQVIPGATRRLVRASD